ncbi:hypothetical protein BDZ91DRAFT_738420 [Kalaharituber pfeilii]|nr:hypothetical protein BDZ91DRAFT_738420 [Kalaharituber pfeilii]
MRGVVDPEFFDSINDIFICLVCTALYHCLEAWRSGVCIPAGRNEFKHRTAGEHFRRIRDTFRAHTPIAQKLLIDTIKAEVSAKINTELRELSFTRVEPLPVDTSDAYEAELRLALQISQMKIPRLPTAEGLISGSVRRNIDLEGSTTAYSSSLASTFVLDDSDSLTEVDSSPEVDDSQVL